MEAWKACCATLDEKVTAVTEQLDEKVVAIRRKRRPSPRPRAAGGRLQARVGQLEGRLNTEIEQLNDELACLEGRIFDQIRGEQVYRDDQKGTKTEWMRNS